MSWSIGYDTNWQRDIGYGVPAYCDQPGCDAQIDRGLSQVCGSYAYGGEHGCGLYFCEDHRYLRLRPVPHTVQLCDRCGHMDPKVREQTHEKKPDHPEWIRFKLTDESWAEWRGENPTLVEEMRKQVNT